MEQTKLKTQNIIQQSTYILPRKIIRRSSQTIKPKALPAPKLALSKNKNSSKKSFDTRKSKRGSEEKINACVLRSVRVTDRLSWRPSGEARHKQKTS